MVLSFEHLGQIVNSIIIFNYHIIKTTHSQFIGDYNT